MAVNFPFLAVYYLPTTCNALPPDDDATDDADDGASLGALYRNSAHFN